jgi:hypothetical protein
MIYTTQRTRVDTFWHPQTIYTNQLSLPPKETVKGRVKVLQVPMKVLTAKVKAKETVTEPAPLVTVKVKKALVLVLVVYRFHV